MNDDPTLVRALLACYPSRWRRRYGDEYAALLHDHLRAESASTLIVDALRGAIDAAYACWEHPCLVPP